MKNCKEVENNLPLYLDDLLPLEDKRAVEEHLKSCPDCTGVLAQLQETKKLVNNLTEVEPPAWFRQKIMARVREEAGKKSLVQKWFYPLRIKIPVQVFATVFIAVLAVYIYRAGEEQMKEVVPFSTPAPVMEISKNKTMGRNQPPESAAMLAAKEKIAIHESARDGKTVIDERSSGAPAPKAEQMKKALPQENVRVEAANEAKDGKEDVISAVKADKYAGIPEKSFEASTVQVKGKKDSNIPDMSMKASRAPQPQGVIRKATVLLRVADIAAAREEVEKLLIKFKAKNIVSHITPDKAVMTAELKDREMKNLTAQLKTIGQVETHIVALEKAEGTIFIVIEIFNQ